MNKKVSKKAKRRLLFAFLLLAAVFVAVFGSVLNDWKTIYKNKKEVSSLNSKYEKLLEEEKSLESEVTKFQDPDYVARYAREKFLYSLPGELIIKIPKGNTE